MRTQSTAPASGQFAATWIYLGKVWSATFRWDGDILEESNSQANTWHRKRVVLPDATLNPTFYIAE